MSLELSSEIYDRYSSGWCMHLAAALHRKLGWEIQAVFTNNFPINYVEHAWVVDPTRKKMLDIDGLNPISKNGWIYPGNRLYEKLSEADLKELTRSGCSSPIVDFDAEWEQDVRQALLDIEKSPFIRKFFAKYASSNHASPSR